MGANGSVIPGDNGDAGLWFLLLQLFTELHGGRVIRLGVDNHEVDIYKAKDGSCLLRVAAYSYGISVFPKKYGTRFRDRLILVDQQNTISTQVHSVGLEALPRIPVAREVSPAGLDALGASSCEARTSRADSPGFARVARPGTIGC